MTKEWQVVNEAETLNEFSDALQRQLRGGSGGGGGGGFSGGGSWGGSSGYYGGSSYYGSSYGSNSDDEMSPTVIVIIVVILVLFVALYICAQGGSSKGERNIREGFDAAVNRARESAQVSITATIHKPTQQTKCGIGMKNQDGAVIISSIHHGSLFVNSNLEVGMIVKSINNVAMVGRTSTEATQLIKDAVGDVSITVSGDQPLPNEDVTATVYKATEAMRCGIGMKNQDGAVIISSIHHGSLFADTKLKAGMIVKTINNVPVAGRTSTEATQLIKDAVGQVVIVAEGLKAPFETYSGTFDMSYVDRGNQFRGHVMLKLKNNERGGYTVSGTTSDADGSAVIMEGLVTYEGDAWWVDEVQSGNDRGLRVLTTGKFHWSTNNFFGSWRASTGQTGQYTSFQCTNVTKTFASVTPATMSPVVTAAVAMPVNPLYSQTPIVTAVAESSSPVVTATANKVVKDMSVGIGIKAPNGTPVISTINPDGLFATSGLRVGMDVQSINGHPMSGKTAAEATRVIKDAVGEITIVAGWNLSISTPITAVPMASAPPVEPEVYVPSYQ